MTSVLVSGGEVYDPDAGAIGRRDVLVVDGRFAAPDGRAADRVIDAAGRLVTPGLVDLHAHVFRGQDLGLDPDDIGPSSGTTTIVDAGSAGGHLFDAFRTTTIESSVVRVRAFVNIASVGTTSIRLGGELKALHYSDAAVAAACVRANRDVVVGVKVRASHDVGGGNAPEALRRARSAADELGVPLMVHLGPAPAEVDEILAALRAGDILTHAFTGWEGNTLLDGDGIRASAREARERGVVFDIGHGASGFSAAVARGLLARGFPPDTISSDLHAYSRDRVGSLPLVLSKLLALGMPLTDVLLRATLAPARAAGLDAAGIGTLRPGAPADLAILDVAAARESFEDGFGQTFVGGRVLRPVATMIAGEIVEPRREAA
jgi:dihydroorotase